MITIKNTQRAIYFDTQQFKKVAQRILDILDYTDFDLGIWLTTNTTIRKYNKEYRNKDKATDILSFSFYPDLKAGERIKATSAEDKNLGDLIISLEYTEQDAPNWGQTFEERMIILLVHGICHLLGYDHIEEEDYKIMKAQEDFILSRITT